MAPDRVLRKEEVEDLVESDIRIPVGECLRHFLPAWEEVVSNLWVLNVIKNGYSVQFSYLPLDPDPITPVLLLDFSLLELISMHVLVDLPPQERNILKGFLVPNL